MLAMSTDTARSLVVLGAVLQAFGLALALLTIVRNLPRAWHAEG